MLSTTIEKNQQARWLQLMQRIAEQRDREAFEQVVDEFGGRLLRFLLQRGASHDEAEELVQLCLLRVWQRAAQFNAGQGAFTAWLFRIARNLHIDQLRRHRHEVRGEPDECASGETPDGLVTDQRLQEQVRQELSRLPERQAQVVYMAFYQGKTHAEIATELEIPLGSVKSSLRLAFAKLRSSMEVAL
ncbi:sigma-70 family RNA polymerase sigma factor [Motiliproteus sediminis]|uniref:sigma-70 family RNA polymerase sigma factor n=1 Tax=Motiliproteus sediminis TaxID=1468178 RepID=UPI001AEF6B36|nr:sigma-70 family RNA polymerase sigma factor [Motiliproteus sediminis]